MNKIKLLVASVLFCAMGYAGYTAYERITMSETEKFMLNNIEALTMEEPGGGGGLDTSYIRNEGTCTVSASLEGKVKALGLSIIKVVGDGNIEISGKVVCKLGGDETCRPVECIDIYDKLFK